MKTLLWSNSCASRESVNSIYSFFQFSAYLVVTDTWGSSTVEHMTVDHRVAGSTPALRIHFLLIRRIIDPSGLLIVAVLAL
jgi:hypothetical protein